MLSRFVYLEKSSLLDYEGKLSAVIFTQGCNFRCPFCQNPELIPDKSETSYLDPTQLMQFLIMRKGKLDAVVITGGEPLMGKIDYLVNFLTELREKTDYLVKIDTNGFNPAAIELLNEKELVDYWAMDVKSSLPGYSDSAGIRVGQRVFERTILKSIQLLMQGEVEYEFRTTVVPGLHDINIIKELGEIVRGAKKLYIQNFRAGKTVDPGYASKKGFSEEELSSFKKILDGYVEDVYIRGL